jgi:uncharacterized protein (TIGR01777 family)
VRESLPAEGEFVRWDPEAGEIDAAKLEGVDALIHLAGESVAGGRWTRERKRRILESRVKGTRLICKAVAGLSSRPRVVLSASAVGFYGNRGDEILTEQSPPGDGFLAEVCRAWEAAAAPLASAGVRLATTRFGVVLSSRGGALASMLPAFRRGFGGVLGDGRQFMSWVAIDDAVRALRHILDREDCAGVFNVTAPNPVTNREFTHALGAALGRSTRFWVPKFAAKLALGEMAEELLFSSQRALPQRLVDASFSFADADVHAALSRILGATAV